MPSSRFWRRRISHSPQSQKAKASPMSHTITGTPYAVAASTGIFSIGAASQSMGDLT
jgi:hypothetical protein